MNLPGTVQTAAALAFGWLVFAGYRWIRRRSEVIGAIVAATIVARAILGVALFWISYLRLPIATSLQAGGGFWRLAADATEYYKNATSAATAGTLFPLDHRIASPFFVDILALWMRAVGISPSAAMLLNLCLYMTLVVALVWCFAPINDWRRDLPCIFGVGAYSLSPVVLIHSTQPLKDELCCLLVAMACLGVMGLRWLSHRQVDTRSAVSSTAAAISVVAAILGLAGIRWYSGFIVWCSLALALGACIRCRTVPLQRHITTSIALLVAGWLAFWGGAGPYYDNVGGPRLSWIGSSVGTAALRQIARMPGLLVRQTSSARAGFLKFGGSTNVAVSLRDTPTQQDAMDLSMPIVVARSVPRTLPEYVETAAAGLALEVVPVSALNAVFPMMVGGGRGLLLVADLDTFFFDVTCGFILVLVYRRRAIIEDRLLVVVFALLLSSVTAVLLGYVVTNFGTLWRMRSLVAVPIWVLAATLPRVEISREPSGALAHLGTTIRERIGK